MNALHSTIEIYYLACVAGWFAEVHAERGELLHSTRLYDDPDYAETMARQWIADNERNRP